MPAASGSNSAGVIDSNPTKAAAVIAVAQKEKYAVTV